MDRTFWLVIVGLLGACAQNVVKPVSEKRTSHLGRPSVVLVYRLAATDADVKENESLIAMNETASEKQEERAEIVKKASDAYAEELVEDLGHLGFRAERATRKARVPENALLVVGEFIDVDEGNRMKRLVIGFGSGASRVDARLRVYYAHDGQRTKLLEFATHSDSGKMPGGAVTMGAGAIATGGVTAVGAAGTAAVGGVKAHLSAVERLAAKSAEEAKDYMSEYFGKQGWIAKDQVEKANK